MVIPIEATAGAAILNHWTGAPQWLFALLSTALLMGTNLLSVGNYGEFEFWFALLKVVAIVAFIAVGLLAIFGLLPGSDTSGVSHLTSEGFMPKGWSGVIAAMLTTMFTFMGTEIVTIAAAESPGLTEHGSYQFTLEQIGLGNLTWLLDLVILTVVASYVNSVVAVANSHGLTGRAAG